MKKWKIQKEKQISVHAHSDSWPSITQNTLNEVQPRREELPFLFIFFKEGKPFLMRTPMQHMLRLSNANCNLSSKEMLIKAIFCSNVTFTCAKA